MNFLLLSLFYLLFILLNIIFILLHLCLLFLNYDRFIFVLFLWLEIWLVFRINSFFSKLTGFLRNKLMCFLRNKLTCLLMYFIRNRFNKLLLFYLFIIIMLIKSRQRFSLFYSLSMSIIVIRRDIIFNNILSSRLLFNIFINISFCFIELFRFRLLSHTLLRFIRLFRYKLIWCIIV